MTMRRCAVLLLVAGVLAACAQPVPPPPPSRPVVVRTVAGAAADQVAAYAGEVRARHEADLAFRVGGKIVERPVGLGDTVRKGDLLARLDAGDTSLSANAGAAQVAAAEADLALARVEYERARNLAERKFVSGTAVDTRAAQWQAAEARLRQARAQAGVADNQLAYTRLVADRGGVVTAVPAEVGQVVAAGKTVLRIADPDEREVLIHVPESRVAGLAAGQAAFVKPWNAQETTLAGRVREIAGSADTTTRTFAVRVAVARAGTALPLGSTAAVGFPVATGGGVSLPLAALVQRDGETRVWVVGADGKLAARAVEVVAYRDDGALIRAGLVGGDRVVVVGAHALTAGMAVTPVADVAAPALDARR